MKTRQSMSDILRLTYNVFLEPVLATACCLMAKRLVVEQGLNILDIQLLELMAGCDSADCGARKGGKKYDI